MNREEEIIAWIQGEMKSEDAEAFQQLIDADPSLSQEVDDYTLLYHVLDNQSMEKPSANLKMNFQDMLDKEMEEKTSKTIPIQWIRNGLAVAAVLLIGVLVGLNISQRDIIHKMDSQTAQLITTMEKNLNSESVTERIGAIQVSNNFNEPKNDIFKTLITTMRKDNSPNVRLAAVEALNRHGDKEIVREAFVRQLTKEKDSFVLIALINALSEQKVEEAIDPLEAITRDMNQAKFIQDEAYLGLIKIQKI